MYRLPNVTRAIKSRRMRGAAHAALIGQMKNTNKNLLGKSERRRHKGRPKHRWEDNFKMDVREICIKDMDSSG